MKTPQRNAKDGGEEMTEEPSRTLSVHWVEDARKIGGMDTAQNREPLRARRYTKENKTEFDPDGWDARKIEGMTPLKIVNH